MTRVAAGREDAGLPPLLQAAAVPLGWGYASAMALRNLLFDRGLRRVHRLPIPVVSVGNLRLGGTGKTPLVAWLLEQAHAEGRRPAVLSRGYGRRSGAPTNDEGLLLQRRYPWTKVFSAPDRVAAGRAAVAAGYDFAVLDDGFQHRRLHRDVDLVCLDARRPFDRVVPAGMQREWSCGLRRAHGIVLTRWDLANAVEQASTLARVAEVAPVLPVFRCRHAARDLVRQPDGSVLPLSALAGRSVWLLSAIARPATFEATVRASGARLQGHTRGRDHQAFDSAEVEKLARELAARDAWLVVTEKDDVKLCPSPVPRYVLRIDIQFDVAPSAAQLCLR